MSDFNSPFMLDRRQILKAGLAGALNAGVGLAAGPDEWASYPDPFPEWMVEHHH